MPSGTRANPPISARLDIDACVYGATSAGVAAAITLARRGRSVVIVDAGRHIGGLTTGGLGATDVGCKSAIGGFAREFYELVAQHYAKPGTTPWVDDDENESGDHDHQQRQPDRLGDDLGRPTQWTFEPSVARRIFESLIDDTQLEIHLDQRLVGVESHAKNKRIERLTFASGLEIASRIFIDASYEGDLMAKAGVTYRVGRESNHTFGERRNGVRTHTPEHQFPYPVDPYLRLGDPSSGLIPHVQPHALAPDGTGDGLIQAYNFRLCMTRVAKNRVAWKRPEGYRESDYELLARYIESHEKAGDPIKRVFGWGGMMYPVRMPNGKTDTNNSGPVSTDAIGLNHNYPEADFDDRRRIVAAHEHYTRGLLYFLATHSRVPRRLRDEMQDWGLAADEFVDNDHWPTQLYIRECRRMVSDYVVTENDCQGHRVANDGVGLAAYQMDSHNCQRIVVDGCVRNEGDVQAGVEPFPVSYRSIVPRRGEASNLLVPVCVSASHIAFGSVRMEPVFMLLGQSAAIAADLAMDDDIDLQTVPYPELREELLSAGQVLTVDDALKPPSTRSRPKITAAQ